MGPFGLWFYEWWVGLRPVGRYSIALAVLACALIWAFFDTDGAWCWGPLAVAGGLLLLLAGVFRD
jgi:hypothetical protein